jgi:potassium-transporting ATPase potassium-binding subunit
MSGRDGAFLGAMAVLFALGLSIIYPAEASGNLHFTLLGIDQSAGSLQAGGNMEGKEVRFGIAASTLFANSATATSDGAVNGMHDSFEPLSGGMLMANMMMDEVIVGAPGSGLFGMLLYAIIAVFVAGLMVGRTGRTIIARLGLGEPHHPAGVAILLREFGAPVSPPLVSVELGAHWFSPTDLRRATKRGSVRKFA